ncbi:hypothetical protein QBC35DRAFT_510245 [Podospora australis]|uniref:Uncharacterized protein n=1 Tax=Podospora australis TaxID=1536484 RepID=A0AAN6WHR0_9PEZI|nr:hypothetical protein QBC35DRAFT_510245 [Podospora australis]
MPCTSSDPLDYSGELCWMQRFADRGYQFGRTVLGVPEWLGFFSSQTKPAMQMIKTASFLYVLVNSVLLVMCGILPVSKPVPWHQRFRASMRLLPFIVVWSKFWVMIARYGWFAYLFEWGGN